MPEILVAGASTAFIAGLLGGGHCIGMCGGIVSALSFALPPSQRHPLRIAGLMLSYNLGRIFSYSLAGVLVGSLGQLLMQQISSLSHYLSWLAVIMLVLMAFYVGQWWRGITKLEKIGVHLWRFLEPLGRKLIPVTNPGQALLIGAIWGWLPCGLVYSMLILALSSGSGVNGGILLLFFGLGTLPTLLVTGMAARKLSHFLRHKWWRQASAILLLAFAIWLSWPLLNIS